MGQDPNSTRSRLSALCLNPELWQKLGKILGTLAKIAGEIAGLVVLVNDILTFIKTAQGVGFYVPILWRIPYLPTVPTLWRLFP